MVPVELELDVAEAGLEDDGFHGGGVSVGVVRRWFAGWAGRRRQVAVRVQMNAAYGRLSALPQRGR